MERLQIGRVIYELRKARGVTQEQLADFIGVSTAAVSKWESGISYPDITLLPSLATFFNVTTDKLLNFNIEISDEEVMNIYGECEAAFSKSTDLNGLNEAIECSKNYLQKYTKSYFLKFRMGFLFSFYSWKGGSEEKCMNMIGEAIRIFEDVALNCANIELVEPALFQLGSLYSSMGEYDKAIAALNKIHKSQCDPNDILASVYSQQGKFKESRKMMQGKLYKSINDISLTCIGLANSYEKCEKDFDTAQRYYNLSIDIKKLLSDEHDSVIPLMTEYLALAESNLHAGKNTEAIENLRALTECIRRHDINQLADINKLWCFNELEVREQTITMNLYENLFKMFEAPVFDIIRDDDEFTKILEELMGLEKGYSGGNKEKPYIG